MPKYFNGLRTEGGIFGNEADNWNNEHKDEEERLKGGHYRPQKKNEFIPVEDLQSRGLSPEEELIAKEEGKMDAHEKETELNEDPGNEISGQGRNEDNSNNALEGADNAINLEEESVDDVINLNEGKDEELMQSDRRDQEVESLPKTGSINPQQAAGWDARKYNPKYWAHGKRGGKRKGEWPKSLKARERFNKIERESLEKAKEIE